MTGFAVAVDPSPKLHEYVYGLVPPDTIAVKVTGDPVVTLDGLEVKSAVKAVGVTVTFADALAVFPAESIVCRLTVKVPLDEYACETDPPIAVIPSPKFQLNV